MAKILGAKGGQLSVGDSLMIAGAKILSERLLSPIIGNGSLISGGVKVAGSVMLSNFLGGKINDVLGTALMVDGAEDLVTAFLGGTAGSIFGSKSAEVELI